MKKSKVLKYDKNYEVPREMYNPIIFIETVLLDGKVKLYDYQKVWVTEFYNNAVRNEKYPKKKHEFKSIILKCRQCGMSTLYQLMCLYFLLMQQEQSFFIFSKNSQASKEFVRKIKDMYLAIDKRKYGNFIKPLMKNNTTEMVFFNPETGGTGNSLTSLAVKSGIASANSGKNIHIVIDEMGKITDTELEPLLTEIYPMYSFLEGHPWSSLCYISTPVLSDSVFFKKWDMNDNKLLKIKIMWYEIEDRYLEDGITTSMVYEYIEKNREKGIDPTQEELVNLFAKQFLKDIFKYDQDAFLSEYACVFMDLQDCFIDGRAIDRLLVNKELDYEKDDLLEYARRKYGEDGVLITGYDCSLGKQTSDKCMITTFYYTEEDDMFYQLATKQLKMTTPEQEEYINKYLFEKYGDNHVLSMDTGGIGGSVLQHLEYNYPNNTIYGIYPSNKNRCNGFLDMKARIENRSFQFLNDVENIKKDIKMIKCEKGVINIRFVIKRDKTDKDNKNSHGDLAYAIMLCNVVVFNAKDKGESLINKNSVGLSAISLDNFFNCY